MHSLYFYIYQAGIGLGVFEVFVFFQPLRGWIASMAGFHEASSIVMGPWDTERFRRARW